MNSDYKAYLCAPCGIVYGTEHMTYKDIGSCTMTKELKDKLKGYKNDLSGFLDLVKDGGVMVGYLCPSCKVIMFGLFDAVLPEVN